MKPGNVILVNDRPVLFDFGSARRVEGPRPDIVVGTTPYISPEECRLETASSASDVFALGVMLYELLTAELPYADETRARPYPQLDAPRPLRPLRQVPQALDALVMGCLAQAPQDRPALQELLPQLNALISRGPRMWPQGFSPQAAAG